MAKWVSGRALSSANRERKAQDPVFNVCYLCGEYRPDKSIDLSGPYAVCPACGHRHPFRRLPLFAVGGPSGTGKSTICQQLSGRFSGAVLLDADILWLPEFNTPEDNYQRFFEVWLRMAKNIGQSGQPVVIFGAGFCVPDNLEPCVERRYFSHIHYLGLVCEGDELARRLRSRPEWRKSGSPAVIASQLEFNRWLRQEGPQQTPPLDLLDTTHAPRDQTAAAVARWIRERL